MSQKPARGRRGTGNEADRARGGMSAYALTGDFLAEDSGGSHEPTADRAPLPAICGGSDTSPSLSAEQVTAALRAVLDPELGMSVVELGLVYGIEIEGGRVAITMTLTAPGCPIHDAMTDWVRQAVMKIPGVSDVEVAITFDPPWTPDRIQVDHFK